MPSTLTKENEKLLVTMIKDIVGVQVAELIESKMAPYREKMTNWEQHILAAGGTRDDLPPSKDTVIADPRMLDNAAKFEACVQALMVGRGDYSRSADWYKRNYGDDNICKALAATDATAGGFLVEEQVATDVIELLRARSVVRTMNPVIEPMPAGVLRLPRITGGATGTYIAENTNITASEQQFGQVVANAKKLAVLVPVSNDLVRRRAGTSTIVRDDLVDSLATTSDLNFIRSDGTGGTPKGLRFHSALANRLNVNAVVNVANVIGDLGLAIQTLMDASVRMLRVGWLMSPRTWRALLTMTASTGQFILRDEISRGSLMGFPFAITPQIPNNLTVTSTDESELYLVDFADVVIAETTGLMLDVSTEAAYHDGTNVVAAFSQDQSVVRAIMEHDLVVRHEESIVVFVDVDWVTITV